MNIYGGYGRRQVGGGIWTTIKRGIRPILSSLFHKAKPHMITAGKALAKRAGQAAYNVGTNVLNNTNTMKDALREEVDQLKSEAKAKMRGYKRAYLDESDNETTFDNPAFQQGSGYKRRRVMARKRVGKKTTKRTKKQTTKKPVKRIRKKTINKRRKGINKRRVGKKGKRSVSLKAIKDIFSG